MGSIIVINNNRIKDTKTNKIAYKRVAYRNAL
jgi:hypothetical protein